MIEDSTGRAKIFMFGGMAEQVVRRTAADLVEESSANQLLLPSPLRALIGRRFVFQIVISEQTFRTGQLCFQVRKVFNPPPIDGQNNGVHATLGNSLSHATLARTSGAQKKCDPTPLMEASGSSSNKASTLQTYGVTELPTDPKGSATPPPPFAHGAITKTSPQKGNEISEEHGYAPYCYFSSYM